MYIYIIGQSEVYRMDKSIIETVIWEENSKKMYDVMLESLPKLMLSGVRRLSIEWIETYGDDIITEEKILQMVNDIMPKSYCDMVLNVITPLKFENCRDIEE